MRAPVGYTRAGTGPWLLIALSALAASPPPPSAPKPADVGRLLGQLGSDSYPEREAASRALEAIGEPALPSLRQARRSNDPEVQRRAAGLVEAIEGPMKARDLAGALTTLKAEGATVAEDAPPGEIHIEFRDKPLSAAAIAALRALGRVVNYNLTLSGNGIADASLDRLQRLGGLQTLALTLDSRPVSDRAYRKLEKALPGVWIIAVRRLEISR